MLCNTCVYICVNSNLESRGLCKVLQETGKAPSKMPDCIQRTANKLCVCVLVKIGEAQRKW